MYIFVISYWRTTQTASCEMRRPLVNDEHQTYISLTFIVEVGRFFDLHWGYKSCAQVRVKKHIVLLTILIQLVWFCVERKNSSWGFSTNEQVRLY